MTGLEARTPLIIDTDPGIDDALAIMLAVASPEVEVLGMTAVAGNVGLDKTAPNLAALADLVGFAGPIGIGAAGPLWRQDTLPAWDVHGENGLGGYELPATERILEPALPLLARLIEGSERPVTVAAIGPLTNIAGLITHFPRAAARVARFVIMGGATLDRPGNTTPAAEFNIYYDPDAAARLFAFGSETGVPITMVGLNVTDHALVGPAHLPALFASDGPCAQMVGHIMANYATDRSGDGTAQHDAVALAAVIDPDILETRSLFVDVENIGRLTSGMTVVDHLGLSGNAPNCDVALSVDVARLRTLLNTRIAALDERLKEA
ncbi:nucleoside hydrolase [Leucobacter salsicius]|uniref:nucleoside hydrolase n=1 Tax=Leucobacter salsicius TaxID=664638 RepID=UPI00034DC26F|nr:nucleoside hydrolase [Leucobacter salsicius]